MNPKANQSLLAKLNVYRSLLILFVICLIASILSPHFLSISNFFNIIRQVAVGGLVACGMTYVILTEDRKADGLALGLPITININMNSYDRISKGDIIDLKKEVERAKSFSRMVNVKTPSVRQLPGNLSGGNQQKVVIAKLLCFNPDILIFDEPTVGVDVGAKQEIYKILESLTRQGKGIILISSYLPEVMGLSDRLLVMAQGKVTADFQRDEIQMLQEKDILKKASVEENT